MTASPAPDRASATRQTHGVGSARRALQLLLSFSSSTPRRTAAELAEIIEVPIGSIYRYISLFRELGIIEDAPGSRFQLTPLILPVARAAMAVQTAVEVARPLLATLAEEVGETVMLMRQADDVAVCMVSIPSHHSLRVEHPVGHTLPLAGGATTEALLVQMPADERERRIYAIPEDRRPDDQALQEISRRGWSQSDQSQEEGVWACASSLELLGQPPLAITIAAPRLRLSGDQRAAAAERTRAVAEVIQDRWHNGSPAPAAQSSAKDQ